MCFVRILAILSTLLISCTNEKQTSKMTGSDDIVVKTSTIIERKNSEVLSFGGRVNSRNQSEEASLIQGKLDKVYVRAGEKVKKNQILASITPVTKGLSYNQFRVRASTDGIVLTSIKQPGSLVEENEVLFTIGNGTDYLVDVWGSIDDIINIPNSKDINIQLAPSSEYSLKITGKLFSVSSTPDSDSGLYKIRIKYTCARNKSEICDTLSRNSVWAKVDFEREVGKLFILQNKFIPSWTKHLLLLSKNNTVKKVKVEVGGAVKDGTVIVSGVKVGDVIIVSYNKKPSDGQVVKISNNQSKDQN